MCCATNRTNPSGGNYSEGWTADTCLANGICMNVAAMTDKSGNTNMVATYWREMCTSSNWTVGAGCLTVCTEESVCIFWGEMNLIQHEIIIFRRAQNC